MKKLIILFSTLCVLVSFGSSAQVVYLADTAFATDIGFDGAEASCKAVHLEYNGWNMNRAHNQWVADVFTVPTGHIWAFDTVIVYGYQYGSTTTSSFLNCNLQIYDAAPGLGGSVIWGDTSTNVLVSTGWTGMYKVDTFTSDNGLNGTFRPLMYLKLYLATPPVLGPGSYWLSWSSAGSLTNNPVAPDKVLPGRINPSGQQGRGYYGGTWSYLNDSGQVNGMDMIIEASAAVAASVPLLNSQSLLLDQNVPNPFNITTSISFYMPQAGYAKLTVYNTLGQEVAVITDGNVGGGAHHETFHTENMPSGVYYYQLKTLTGVESRKMMLVR